MAYDFPSNPTNGQVYLDYVYDSASGWRSQVMVGAAPCGSIMPFAGATIPAGWLLCDGAAVSRTTYSSLFAALGGISSPWGLGNGSTTFNVPDLRTRVPVGKNGSGTFSTLGAIGGAETMSLQEAHLASHFHYYSATTSWNGDHNHAPPVSVVWNGNASQDRRIMTTNYGLWSAGDWYNAVTTNGAHNHTISGNTDSRGSGQAFGLLQPYAVVNYIIKYSAVVAATDTEIAVRMGQAEATVNGYTSRLNALEQTPAFVASTNNGGTLGNTSSATVIVFGNVRVNRGSGYNSSNGRFTAPKAGLYRFDFKVQKRSGGALTMYWYKNGVNYDRGVYSDLGGDSPGPGSAIILSLAAGDYVNVAYVHTGGGDIYTAGEYFSWFMGEMIGQ